MRSLSLARGVDGGMADYETRALVELAAVLLTALTLSAAVFAYGLRAQRR